MLYIRLKCDKNISNILYSASKGVYFCLDCEFYVADQNNVRSLHFSPNIYIEWEKGCNRCCYFVFPEETRNVRRNAFMVNRGQVISTPTAKQAVVVGGMLCLPVAFLSISTVYCLYSFFLIVKNFCYHKFSIQSLNILYLDSLRIFYSTCFISIFITKLRNYSRKDKGNFRLSILPSI